jgi:RNA polymerase sigma factor (sigma-70 family)
MTEGKSDSRWPGADERTVVEEMIHNQYSKHWEECNKFVKRCVYAKAKNIPNSYWEDIIQDVMYKVAKALPGFHFHCALKTWLNTIIEHCIIDLRRKLQKQGPFNAHLGITLNESDLEGGGVKGSETKSAEDISMTIDELRNAQAALLEYANTHSNPTRDRLIIWMVLFEGRTHVETAKAAGCNAPVVGYVVREAQRYASEKMGHKL